MNREIRFRAWVKQGSPFHMNYLDGFTYLPTMAKRERVHLNLEHDSGHISGPLSSIVLMQFTGLHDMHGNEIYEGDILKCETGIGFVVWEDIGFAIQSPGSEAVDWEHSSFYKKTEVIGNIYQNPELIS